MELWFHDWCKLIQVLAATERICHILSLLQIHPYLVLALMLMGRGQVNLELTQQSQNGASLTWESCFVSSQIAEIPSYSLPRISGWFLVCDPEASGTDKGFSIK